MVGLGRYSAAERELKFLTQRHKATEKKKTKPEAIGCFSDPQIAQITLSSVALTNSPQMAKCHHD